MTCGKLAIFFVVAFCAVQGLEARHFHSVQPIKFQNHHEHYSHVDPRISLDEIVQMIQEFIQKIKDIIGNAGSSIPEIIEELKKKIQEILEGLNENEIVQAIIKAIEKIIGNISEQAQKCIDAEMDKINALAEETQKGSMECVNKASAQTEELQKAIEALMSKGEALIADVKARAQKCWDDNFPNPIGIYNCLAEQVDPVKEEIMQLEKEVEATIAMAQELAGKVGTELSECMNAVAEQTAAKEQEIADDIKQCMLGQPIPYSHVDPRMSLDDIVKMIQQIIEKIKDAIAGAGSINDIIAALQKKIQEIIDKLNENDLAKIIIKAIEMLIGDITDKARACINADMDKINALAQQTQEAAMACVNNAQAQTEELQGQIQNVVNKGEALVEDVKARAQKCWDDNFPNPIAIYNCLSQQIDPIKQEIVELEKEVETTIAMVQKVVPEVSAQLSECMAKVSEEAAVKEQEIADDVKKCMME